MTRATLPGGPRQVLVAIALLLSAAGCGSGSGAGGPSAPASGDLPSGAASHGVTAASPGPTAIARSPEETAARAWLAVHVGAPADAFELVASTTTHVAGGEASLWSGKFLLGASGDLHLVYVTPAGEAFDSSGLEAYEARILGNSAPLDRKADEALRAALAKARATDRLQVGVWVRADTDAALARVRARYPNVDWSTGLPDSPDPAVIDGIRAAIYREKEAAIDAALQPIAAAIRGRGAEVLWQAGSAPLLFARLTPADLAAVASRGDVVEIDLDSSR